MENDCLEVGDSISWEEFVMSEGMLIHIGPIEPHRIFKHGRITVFPVQGTVLRLQDGREIVFESDGQWACNGKPFDIDSQIGVSLVVVFVPYASG